MMMRTVAVIMLVVALIMGLTGCSANPDGTSIGVKVRTITMPSGRVVECVLYAPGSGGGALACWEVGK